MDWDETLALGGRILMAAIFLASAFGNVTNFEATTKYMERHGMPFPPFFCAAAAVVESLGGIALVLGFQARRAAGILSVFLIAATWIFHAAPEQRIDMLKNLAILGGLFQVMAFGPGRLSLDGRSRS